MKAVGVCGKIGSGKDVAADRLVEKHGYTKVQLSDLMAEEMEKKGIPVNREAFQRFTQERKKESGKGVWAQKAVEHIRENKIEKAVIVGIRDSAELPVFRKEFPGFKLVFIKASPETRLRRLVERGSRKDITDLEDLARQEAREAEIFDIYERYGEISDFTLENEGTIGELQQRVDELAEKENLL